MDGRVNERSGNSHRLWLDTGGQRVPSPVPRGCCSYPSKCLTEIVRSAFLDQTFVYSPVLVVTQDDSRPPRSAPGTAGAHETAELARSDQRSRLLSAIVEIVARSGYPETKIGDIASQAGVSRATFYELFENKETCFVAAHRELAQRLGADTARTVAES